MGFWRRVFGPSEEIRDFRGPPPPMTPGGERIAMPPDLTPRRPFGHGGGEEILELVERLHIALVFMRSCEVSGEHGADHPWVIAALQDYDDMRRP